MANVELKTIWVKYDPSETYDYMSEVTAKLGEGWELVQWQPLINPSYQPHPGEFYDTPIRYDVFLLKKG